MYIVLDYIVPLVARLLFERFYRFLKAFSFKSQEQIEQIDFFVNSIK